MITAHQHSINGGRILAINFFWPGDMDFKKCNFVLR